MYPKTWCHIFNQQLCTMCTELLVEYVTSGFGVHYTYMWINVDEWKKLNVQEIPDAAFLFRMLQVSVFEVLNLWFSRKVRATRLLIRHFCSSKPRQKGKAFLQWRKNAQILRGKRSFLYRLYNRYPNGRLWGRSLKKRAALKSSIQWVNSLMSVTHKSSHLEQKKPLFEVSKSQM